MRFLPGAMRVSEIVERITKKAFPPGTIEFMRIQDAWLEIAGAELARRALPFKMDGHRLVVEVSHPAWMSHLKAPVVKGAMLKKIEEILGKPFCKDMVFIIQGRRAPESQGEGNVKGS